MNMSSIGKRIRKFREAKGWRQEDFAEKIGLSVTYTGMIERGEKVPKLETFITIANTLEVSADLLLADVLSTGYQTKSSEMTEDISSLAPSERDRIYSVVNAMIQFAKKKCLSLSDYIGEKFKKTSDFGLFLIDKTDISFL